MADALIAPSRLVTFASTCFEKLGLLPADAALVARSLVASNLRGVDSHGVVRLPHYATRLRNGSIKSRPAITVQRSGPCTAQVDGDAGMGQLVAARAMQEAIAMAQGSGVGVASARNSSHCGALAFYVEMAVEAGLAGIALSHADPIMVPTGMRHPFLGSNPMAFGAPAAEGPPLIIDMATTHVPLGKILVARQEGQSIPSDWGVDQEGQPTTDPNRVAGLRPMAGPKGYALAMLIEVLCAPLAGVPYGPHMCKMYGDLERPRDLGHFLLALDPARFTDAGRFRAEIALMIREIHKQVPADPQRPPLAPGEPERLTAAKRAAEGIPMGPGLVADLNKLASELQVEKIVG